MRKAWIYTAILMAVILAWSCAWAEGSGRVIVSLGDSYSSGEGVEPFYGQDADIREKVQNPDWLAHRSEAAWPGLLTLDGVDGTMKDHRGENWFFVPASGAEAKYLFQLTEEEIRMGKSAEQEKKYNRDGVSGTVMLAPQLDVFDELDAKGLKADYVTVTIGGNDIGFQLNVSYGYMGLLGLMNGSPEEIAEQMWKPAFDSGTRDDIKRALHDIAGRAGQQAWIIVVGYPELMNPEGGDQGFPPKDAQIMNLGCVQFNAAIRGIVEECRGEGMKICYVSVEEAFAGHGAYTEDPYVNPVMLSAQAQDLKEIVLASMYSMHPNEKGNQIYAACVQAMIDRLENGEIPD